MRHDDHCHPGSVDFAQQLHDLDRRLAIERSRRFVGQNHLRLRNQSAGNGYCPPDISLGMCSAQSFSPTRSKYSSAKAFLFFRETP